MNVADAIRELVMIRERLSAVGVLENAGHAAVEDALRALRIQQKKRAAPWSYRIARERPLSLRLTDPSIVKHRMSIDVFADISQPLRCVPQKKQSVTVRVWCHDRSLWHDELLDAADMEKQVERAGGKRVMLRFRFDHDDPDDDHPWFHLQIGGQQAGGELHRMPANLARPRFLHHPMNLLMVCEFVVRHFYPREFAMLANEPSWRIALCKAQTSYLPRYLAHHAAYDPSCNSSFLNHMWNIR